MHTQALCRKYSTWGILIFIGVQVATVVYVISSQSSVIDFKGMVVVVVIEKTHFLGAEGRTGRRTDTLLRRCVDGRADGRRPSYGDAWTHLKTVYLKSSLFPSCRSEPHSDAPPK